MNSYETTLLQFAPFLLLSVITVEWGRAVDFAQRNRVVSGWTVGHCDQQVKSSSSFICFFFAQSYNCVQKLKSIMKTSDRLLTQEQWER